MAKVSKKTIELLKTPASRQDSVDVLNAQLAQNAYYDKLKKYLKKPVSRYDYYPETEKLFMDEHDINNELENSRDMIAGKDIFSERYKELNVNKKDLVNKAAQLLKYAKSEGRDKYHYLDLVTPLLNFAAPLALFNNKIKPKGTISRDFDLAIPGGSVTTWEYDPLAVTPVDMLTEEQKKQREKIYGPQSYSKRNTTKPVLENIQSNENIDLNTIPSKQLKELKTDFIEQPEMYSTKSNKVEYTPEHYIDVVDIQGKNPKRITFESLDERRKYLKENPLLKLDEYTFADSKRRGDLNKKIKPETLALLKNKK